MGLPQSRPPDPLATAESRLRLAGFDPAQFPPGGEQYAPHLAKNKSLYEIIFYLRSYTCSPGLYRF